MNAESRIQRERKEYLELNLVAEKKSEEDGLVKVGTYYMKKLPSIEIPQILPTKCYYKNYIEGSELDRLCKNDYFVKDDPQYNFDYTTEIFKHLRENEVSLNNYL